MKVKAILTFLGLFIGTPLILGQSSVPSSFPSSFSTPTIPNLPSIPATPAVPTSLPLESLQSAGINPSSLTTPTLPFNIDSYRREGFLGNSLPFNLPTGSDSVSALAKDFAQKTFPQEFQAAQGKLNNIPALPTNGNFSSVLPSNLSTPNLSTPNLPSL